MLRTSKNNECFCLGENLEIIEKGCSAMFAGNQY